MEALIVGAQWEAQQWQLHLENASEAWRGTPIAAHCAAEALQAQHYDVLVLCPGPSAEPLLTALYQAPTLRAPWLIGDGWSDPRLDLMCPLSQAEALPEQLRHLYTQGILPHLTQVRLPQLCVRATALLHRLDMQPRLGAWTFLPEMLSLCAIHPALLRDMTCQLYPLCARRHHLTPACVERRLRLAVESTWNRTDVDTLEAFFGQTIDPQRGKPTNKEFLAMLSADL